MKKLIFLLLFNVPLFVSAQNVQPDSLKNTDELLSQLVKKALVVADKTGEFVIEQTPLLLQEFYNWQIAKTLFWLILSLVGVWIIFVLFAKLKSIKRQLENDGNCVDWGDAEMFFPAAVLLLGFAICCIILFTAIHDLLFLHFAPKIYLIEYFVK